MTVPAGVSAGRDRRTIGLSAQPQAGGKPFPRSAARFEKKSRAFKGFFYPVACFLKADFVSSDILSPPLLATSFGLWQAFARNPKCSRPDPSGPTAFLLAANRDFTTAGPNGVILPTCCSLSTAHFDARTESPVSGRRGFSFFLRTLPAFSAALLTSRAENLAGAICPASQNPGRCFERLCP